MWSIFQWVYPRAKHISILNRVGLITSVTDRRTDCHLLCFFKFLRYERVANSWPSINYISLVCVILNFSLLSADHRLMLLNSSVR